MNLPDLQTEDRPAEIRHEAPEIPDMPLNEVRRRVAAGAEHLVAAPGRVVELWLAPLSGPSLGVGEA